MKEKQIIAALKAEKKVEVNGRPLALFNGRIVTVIRCGRFKAYAHADKQDILDAKIID